MSVGIVAGKQEPFLLRVRHRLGNARRWLFSVREFVIYHSCRAEEAPWYGNPGYLRELKERLGLPRLVSRQAYPEDLPLFAPWHTQADLARLQRWWQEGRECFIALDREQLVAYVWLTQTEFYDELAAYRMPVQPGEPAYFDVHSRPDYVGTLAFLVCVCESLFAMLGRGYTRGMGWVPAHRFLRFQRIYQWAQLGYNVPWRYLRTTRVCGMVFHQTRDLNGRWPDQEAEGRAGGRRSG